jgi:hypothetical protein
MESARKAVATIALRTTLPNNKGISIDIGSITQTGFSASAGGMWAGSATLRRITDRYDLEV